MDNIPRYSFDLVVANPPNYCNIQQEHPCGFLRNDLRPSDIDWHIHQDFYKTISKYLHASSKLYISEVAVNDLEVIIDGNVYDRRPVPPIQAFQEMISKNGLQIIDKHPFTFNSISCDILEIMPNG